MVGLFSATYPHLVERVTMICPASRHPVDLLVSWCVLNWLVVGLWLRLCGCVSHMCS